MGDEARGDDRSDTTPAPSDTLGDTLRSLGAREGDVLAGKYRVERVLGRGAMGIVVSATHLALGERVALKLLSPLALGRSSLARFDREAKAAARIRSQHVPRVMDIGTLEGGTPFIVMEHLDGADLAAVLRERGRLPISEAVDLILEACDALAEAHALGIVHRDLKPGNLFLARRRGSTTLKVLDFGVSKLTTEGSSDARLTAAFTVVGSPHYMSPEQIECARDVDARADVWSLGVILYEIVAGVRPFEASSREALFLEISTTRPRSLREACADVPAGFEAVVSACLEPKPERRIQDVGELARRLSTFGGARAPLLVDGIESVLRGGDRGSATAPEGARRERAPARGGTRDESEDEDVASLPSDALGAASWSSSASEDDPLVGTTLGGRFTLRRVIGRGGMGIVYEARDPDGAAVAVKVIRPHSAREPSARERLIREAEAAKRVVSEHVARIHEVAVDAASGAPFIVMDLLRGEDLAALIARVVRLEPRAVARLFAQVCRGLADAHASGLVHRDVKPANIFLHEEPGGKITVKICDFGIVKSTLPDAGDAPAQALTRTGAALGSPLYMSPEQAKNARRVDQRTDVWSACISMYEAISGRNPWAACTAHGEVLLAVCTQEIAPLHKVAPWVPRRLSDAVHRGLRREPSDRFRDAGELEAALRALAGPGDTLDATMLEGFAPAKGTAKRAVGAARRSLVIALLAGGGLAAGLVTTVLNARDSRPRVVTASPDAGRAVAPLERAPSIDPAPAASSAEPRAAIAAPSASASAAPIASAAPSASVAKPVDGPRRSGGTGPATPVVAKPPPVPEPNEARTID